MTFEIYTVEENSSKQFGPKKGDIRVRFPEYGADHCVEKDDNGELYFSVPNIIGSFENLEDRLFIGRIKDAYDMIVNGDGDVIQTSAIFGLKTIQVIKFVNYDYGKEMRKKFLEGWKNTKFGWGIEAGNGNSFEGFSAVCENMTTYNRYLSPAENSVPLYFDTEEEARTEMDKIVRTCREYEQRYFKETSREKLYAIFDEIEDKYGLFSVYMNYMTAKEGENGGKEYKFRVVQRVR